MRSSNAGNTPSAGVAVAVPANRSGVTRLRSAAVSTPGAIRPLALAPGASRSTARDSTLDFTTMSGSGGNPPAYYPTLKGSGGSVGSILAPGEDPAKPKNWILYNNNPAPIGDIMHFWVENIDTSKILSYTWSGGSDIKSYFGGDGQDASSLHKFVSMTPGVPTNQAGYDFIIPATVAPQNYDVKLTIKYKAEPTGTAPDSVLHCTFTTVSPDTATLTVEHQGTPQAGNPYAFIWTGLCLTPYGETEAESGIEITASTKAASSVGGKFMFLQLVKPDRSRRFNDRVTGLPRTEIMEARDERSSPPGWASGEWNLDDPCGKTGYWLAGYPPDVYVHEWSVSAGETSRAVSMWDSQMMKYYQGIVLNLTIGHKVPAGSTYSPEHYVTYLMYQPPSGV
ncbi:hypothetical protein [Paludisphaera borealis]|uniref:hypothetical protein n=1 Tax=Paludisphaera borealis TaxID=1387353 RepID=UPI000970CB50|nr:hypothetical protein [Paludisphaera borealis]